jgi:hypothetical protein
MELTRSSFNLYSIVSNTVCVDWDKTKMGKM